MTEIILPAMPESICQASLCYTVDAAQLARLKVDGVVLPESLANAVLKRQVEFAAGRFCAREALQKRGCDSPATLAIGQHRAPLWPAGYLGSISHGDGLAIAVVAAAGEWHGLGIDIERVLTNEAAQPLVEHLMTAPELAIGNAAGLALEHWLSLIFSAKESLFKALYPFVGRYFDFLDVEVCELQEQQSCIMLRLATSLSPSCVKGSLYCIRYSYFSNNIATLCLF
ncbi:4'-phosphopantetheinyl transferase family protein [Collimonas silvisoli]|uniref:4'-phosphopantetheinyl transferase family protein n=1 Tax=Collimonas silvisoli TaxID=2825884 RepID=UPI001B8D2687|nr:4'-phosphopantetheinyl transferase superfamily protein [Collimonas silvisoli]